ncbi:hypothetical protein RADP37_05560 [Roseomonas mucosa]|uniref:Uncharacterized protein n=1 Tax=Roseomonas mucosa TaxID=207340 RepID=A0A4Y1MYC0_9PROT|nr:hypothetical protein RADP37_05560 [Roseomonas mucosa]
MVVLFPRGTPAGGFATSIAERDNLLTPLEVHRVRQGNLAAPSGHANPFFGAATGNRHTAWQRCHAPRGRRCRLPHR